MEEEEANVAVGESSREEDEKKEHMFDKVVTPSDVGKLNRLVIPKQHAERYFPLDSTIDNKGLLLNFEDRTGNLWRFRYSYWNSSQSYVMTKGWSRFVKDKKLDAGDIVSFHRNPDNKLFIDWKRRPKILHQDHHHQSNFESHWFPRLYSYHPLEQFSRNHESFDLWGQNRHFHQFSRDLGYGYLVRNNPTAVIDPLVIESVPVMMHRRGGGEVAMAARGVGGEGGSGKRLRLFGVDMECNVNTPEPEPEAEKEEEEEEESSSGGGGLLELRLVSNDESLASLEDEHHHFSKKGKSSLSFDLD